MSSTGNGTTFALTTITGGDTAPSGIGRVVSYSEVMINGEAIEDPDLTTDLMEYLAGDITRIDSMTIQVVFDSGVHTDIAMNNLLKPYDSTLTFPLQSDESTAASLAGSGFFLSAPLLGNLESDARSEASLTWQYDNKETALAYTAGVLS